MRLHPAWIAVLIIPAAGATGPLASGAEPASAAPTGYERRYVEGFTVYVNTSVFQQPRDRWGRQPFTVLEQELNDLRRILVPKILCLLQREVPVWVEWDKEVKPCPDGKTRSMACYRRRLWSEGWREGQEAQAEAWRKEALRLNPKAGSIEVCSLRLLGEARQPGSARQQVTLLHEMAHAVQDRLVGWKHPDLLAAYQQAVDRNLYENVTDRSGRRARAYARTNAIEYFAEISCAYLDSCNSFPFNHEQLRGYDPTGFAFVERVWKHPDEVKAGGPMVAARVPTVYEERTAQLKLDRLKAKANGRPADEVKKGLQDLVRELPGTAAADEARTLLKSLD